VVALTAFAMQGDRDKAIEAGFDDYITKPVTLSKLKAQLDQ
jgi:CheY-like chemotaxis protein